MELDLTSNLLSFNRSTELKIEDELKEAIEFFLSLNQNHFGLTNLKNNLTPLNSMNDCWDFINDCWNL